MGTPPFRVLLDFDFGFDLATLERASVAVARRPSNTMVSGDFLPPADALCSEPFPEALARLSAPSLREASARPNSFLARPARLRSLGEGFGAYLVLVAPVRDDCGCSRPRRERSAARWVLCGALHLLTRSARGRSGAKDFPARRSAASTEFASYRPWLV